MNYEYLYQTPQTYHHHDYIIPALLSLINDAKMINSFDNSQLRILDIGCGNGSLTAQLAAKGYKMVGDVQK